MIELFPEAKEKIFKLRTDIHRLRALFIKLYCKNTCKECLKNKMVGLQDLYDVRKYAVYLDKDTLHDRIFKRTTKMLQNLNSYDEVLDLCKECVEKNIHKTHIVKQIPIFKVIGVAEYIKYLANVSINYHLNEFFRSETLRFFKSIMIRTRHYSKLQYDWLKTSDFNAVINTPGKEEEIANYLFSHIQNNRDNKIIYKPTPMNLIP